MTDTADIHPVSPSRDRSTYLVVIHDGFDGVVKLAHLLRAPGCAVTSFSARQGDDATSWTVEYDYAGTTEQEHMLRKRIYRLPGTSRITRRR